MTELLPLPVVAERLGVSRRTVDREIARGRLRAVKVGRRTMVSTTDLAAYRPPRRDNGTGSVYQSKHGHWVGVAITAGGRRIQRRRATKEEAEAALAQVIAERSSELGTAYRQKRRRKPAKRSRPVISTRTRWLVLERDAFRCRYCGAGPDDEQLQVDHVVPLARGGTNHVDNLVTACRRCNQGKATRVLRLVGA